MTRRAWMIVAVGLVLIVAGGAFAVAAGQSASSYKPSPTWGVFDASQWASVQARIAQRGFEPASARVVTAMPSRSGKPFAFVAASRAGRTCFMAVRGTRVAAPVCRLTMPLFVLSMPDRWRQSASAQGPARWIPIVNVIGLARPNVAGIVTTSTNPDGRPWRSGQALLPVPGGWAFGSGSAGSATTLTAYDAKGAVLGRVRLGTAGPPSRPEGT